MSFPSVRHRRPQLTAEGGTSQSSERTLRNKAVAADVLRAQQGGWEAAMVKAVGEAEAAAE